MSQKQSPHKGKRSFSLMNMVKGANQKTASSPNKGKKRASSSTPKKNGAANNKVEVRDSIMSPNTRKLTSSIKSGKIFNDSVHTHINLEQVCVKIVDTPQYQRLHGLKQLGTCDFVFRGATHTRFEHSLGVAHMAARVVRTLQSNQPELGITEIDVLCVKIAGLCHDLGHGPFSHVFDGVFIKKMHPNGINKDGEKWRHEDGSVAMFKFLLRDNEIDLADYDLTELDQTFIEEIINGTDECERKGRERSKFYLYDVVNNARSGLDVDKLDYFQRDMARSGVSTGTSSHDFDRFIDLAVVMPAEPIKSSRSSSQSSSMASSSSSSSSSSFSLLQSQERGEEEAEEAYPLMICYPEKMVRETVSLFATRFNMHQLVYTHKSVKQVEYMVTDALQMADEHIRIQGDVLVNEDHNYPLGLYKMSETIHNMRAFMAMKDSILDIICHEAASNPKLKPARDLINRIQTRKLYRYIGTTTTVVDMSEEEILQEMLAISRRPREDEEASFNLADEDNAHLGFALSSGEDGGYVELTEQDLIVEKMRIHYGMGEENPVNNMRFFAKNATLHLNNFSQQQAALPSGDRPLYSQTQPPAVIAKCVDERVYQTVLPRVFEDRAVRLFCRDPEKTDVAREVFERWCEEANAQVPFPSSLSQSQGGGEYSQQSVLFDGEDYCAS